jgi:hypothetical protein
VRTDEDTPAPTLEIATPHDRVVELRVQGPLGNDTSDIVTWTLAAIPPSSVVLLNLTHAQLADNQDQWIYDSLHDLAQRHIPALAVLPPGHTTHHLAATNTVHTDIHAARDHAAHLADT